MADFTKLVRTLTSGSHEKPSRLKRGVGFPFWIGIAASLGIALYSFRSLVGVMSGWLIASVSLLAAIVGGVLVQAVFDLYEGIRGGEVRKRYLAALVAIVFLAFIYGIIYYRTPDSGFERVFSIASLVVISALFGYIVGRAKG
jgi:hypothetical protein